MSFDLAYEWVLGWRYTRAGRATRRNGFISFISGVSMLGIGLGVAALVIVLSVMNGFQKEVQRQNAERGLAHRIDFRQRWAPRRCETLRFSKFAATPRSLALRHL
jgi:hypothetical protein